jgi:hypothetical protein
MTRELEDAGIAVAELDLNPVIATPDGAVVVDARVRLEAPGRAAPFPSRNALSARRTAYARHVV